jgi:hypothetical protein
MKNTLRSEMNLSQKVYTFDSGVKFRFPGGSEKQYVAPIEAELESYERWIAELEAIAVTGVTPQYRDLPQSQYQPKLGKRSVQAAGVSSAYSDDVYGKSAFVARWKALTARLMAVAVRYESW